MRLITWNCNRAFHRKHDFVAALHPDILIVPECQQISGVTQPFSCAPVHSFKWFGNNPRKGLAVISYGDFALEIHPSYDPRFQWIVPLFVTGPVAFVLFAVWTLPFGGYAGRYARPLLEAFEFYKTVIDHSAAIWAGDFNSNFIWDTPSRRYKFCDFVSLLSERGLHSLYHYYRKCEHGKETDHTFYHRYKADKGYHIDYVFAAERLRSGGIDVSIGSHAEWSRRSDHAPLICDFLEHATLP